MKNVIENDKIPQITTPYFKFYELEAMCAMGRFEDVKNDGKLLGGMLSQGAVTFWEEFDPEKNRKNSTKCTEIPLERVSAMRGLQARFIFLEDILREFSLQILHIRVLL